MGCMKLPRLELPVKFVKEGQDCGFDPPLRKISI